MWRRYYRSKCSCGILISPADMGHCNQCVRRALDGLCIECEDECNSEHAPYCSRECKRLRWRMDCELNSCERTTKRKCGSCLRFTCKSHLFHIEKAQRQNLPLQTRDEDICIACMQKSWILMFKE